MIEINSLTSEDVISELIDAVKKNHQDVEFLIRLLPRNNELYKGRGTNQVNRIRGYAIAAFEDLGLQEEALINVCEELDNGHSPYLLAASAKALRGIRLPNKQLSQYLIKALKNIGHKDEAVSFSSYKPKYPLKDYTTAKQEILKSLAWLGVYAKETVPFLERYANGDVQPINNEIRKLTLETIKTIKNDCRQAKRDCCEFSKPQTALNSKIESEAIKNIQLQDQDGNTVRFGDFFGQSLSVISFFYTRCDNPYKCSLTVTKLAQLQDLLLQYNLPDIKIAAITYDPAYDTPQRLKDYSSNRGFFHNDQYKVFRVLNQQQDLLQNYLKLEVNYNGSIVNQHSIELFIVDRNAIPIKEYSKIEFDNLEILNFLKEKEKTTAKSNGSMSVAINGILPFLFLFFPKCPLCWAAYLSAFGLTGISWLEYNPNFMWIFVLLSVINLVFMYKKAKNIDDYLPMTMALIGYSILFPSIMMSAPKTLTYISIGIITLSTFVSVFRLRHGQQHYIET
ncbi:MAG TPA: SCO family protein [Pyrinomonadaceae bacterium]|jgi:protein SCO1/2